MESDPKTRERNSTLITKLSECHIDENMSFPINQDRPVNMIPSERDFNKKQLLMIMKAQAKFRMIMERKRFRIRQKKIKHRFFVIQELVKTEQMYVQSLTVIKQRILEPLMNDEKRNKYFDKTGIDKIFSVLPNILEFNKNFHKEISSKEKIYKPNSLFADSVLRMMDYFKLYSFYCKEFDNSRKELERLKKENHPFYKWIKDMEFTPTLENLDLASLLVKPVQRLPKYVLLFKDLLKNTEQNHADYENIRKVLEKFQEINMANNVEMEKFVKNEKLFELEKTFGKKKFKILDAKRQYVFEDSLYIIINEMLRPVVCYFLNDMILVTEHDPSVDRYQLLQCLNLDEHSFVRDKQDTKYFSHIFSIYGKEGATTFTCEKKETKEKLIEEITNKVINPLVHRAESRQKALKEIKTMDFIVGEANKIRISPIDVKVLGTVDRTYESLITYTVYIIEINYESMVHRLFLRFSDLIKLEELVKKEFPQVSIGTFSEQKRWFNSRKTKTIESRKIHIENFLQIILQHESVIRKGDKILDLLGLPQGFYDGSYSTSRDAKARTKVTEKIKFGRESVYNALSELYKQKERISSDSYQRGVSAVTDISKQKSIVKLANGRQVEIEFTKYTRASEVCDNIAEIVGLQSSLDFKLFLVNEKKEERVIDDCEFLFKILNTDFIIEEQEIEQSNISLMQKISKSIKSTLNYFGEKIKQEVHLEYKKYLFLDMSMEEKDYKMDPVKLDLLIHQVFEEIVNYKYIFSFYDYAMLSALRCFFKMGRHSKLEPDLWVLEKLKAGIPPAVFERKPDSFWYDSISDYWKKIEENIDEVSKRNKKLNEEKSKAGKSEKLPEKLNEVASVITLNTIKKHRLFGTTLFWVFVYKNKRKVPGIMFEDVLSLPDWVWLAIKWDTIALLSPINKEDLLIISMDQIDDYVSYPSAIIFEVVGKSIRLDTKRSFEIYQLVDEYKKITKYLKFMQASSK